MMHEWSHFDGQTQNENRKLKTDKPIPICWNLRIGSISNFYPFPLLFLPRLLY